MQNKPIFGPQISDLMPFTVNDIKIVIYQHITCQNRIIIAVTVGKMDILFINVSIRVQV